ASPSVPPPLSIYPRFVFHSLITLSEVAFHSFTALYYRPHLVLSSHSTLIRIHFPISALHSTLTLLEHGAYTLTDFIIPLSYIYQMYLVERRRSRFSPSRSTSVFRLSPFELP